MAHSVVGPIMKKLIEACSDYLQDQYRWQKGMKEELERLRENHPKVQAVVSASTQAQIRDRNPALNSWIWRLRDAIDEADDVLDDFEYEKLRKETLQKVRYTMSSLKKTGKRALKMDSNLKRLEKAVKKLDKVSAEVSTFLHLLKNAKQEQQELELQLHKDREEGCLPKNDLIGRSKEKDFVMQWLRNEDPTHIASPTLYTNISLLSIVGHGGMGKTTLIQHVFEDLKEEFELKMWVCVSNHFDAKKVIVDMLDILTKERPPLESPLAALQERLKAIVQSKRFLLVLDDIWEEDMSKWENLLSPLTNGSFRSKILITTRLDAVASAIAKVIRKKRETLRIEGLEEDVCLKLLNTHAFVGVENLDSHTKLKDIASLMVKKLSGSPLATKVIGGVLNSNLNESFWTNILNSTNVLNVKPDPGRSDILSILRLSFTFLPQPLQTCFAFCGIFPQDREFDKDDLIRMWIALGFIQESSIEGETLEDIGGRYFDVLVRKSFFDEFQRNKETYIYVEFPNKVIYYKMHDLLHDLAQSISSEECFGFVGDNASSFKIPKTIRHLFVETKNLEVLRKIKDVQNLHSLFLLTTIYDQDFTEILTKIFKASRSIRLLFLSSFNQKNLSGAIKNLRHLRYLKLDVGFLQIQRFLSSLNHLRFIFYEGSPYSDDFLTVDVSNLSNLRHLQLPRNVFYSVPGIGKLRSLHVIEFNVKNKNCYKIGELEHMNELRKLRLHFLENVKDASEARTAKLFEKTKLTNLFLNWGKAVHEWEFYWELRSPRKIDNYDLDANVLENLKPYKDLKCLSIFSYKGVSSAKWMYDADLISNLEHINLNGCSELETLPPFGQLPRLKSLYLRDMPKVKQFDEAGAAADDCFFPCLTELFLFNCPNLQELPYLPPKLKNMKIQKIRWKAALNCKQETNCCLETLQVTSCPNMTSILSVGGLQLIVGRLVIDDPSLLPTVSIVSLKELIICNNDVLQSLPSSLELLFSLKILIIGTVPQLQQLLHIPASLKELSLHSLTSLHCLPSSLSAISSLEHLHLERIPLLKSLPDLPSSLNSLSLWSLDNLECLPSSLSAISSLKKLDLYRIPLLKSLPDLPSSLDSLSLWSLDNLECQPSSLSAISSLKKLALYRIPLLKSLSDLPSSLDSLSLWSIDNLECLPSSVSSISSLKKLELSRIPLLKSLPDLPSSLDSLSLRSLHNLECLPSSLSAISSLKELSLDSIPLLKSLPDLPPSLYSLDITNCHPTLMKRYKNFSGSDWHKIAHIPHVRIDHI